MIVKYCHARKKFHALKVLMPHPPPHPGSGAQKNPGAQILVVSQVCTCRTKHLP